MSHRDRKPQIKMLAAILPVCLVAQGCANSDLRPAPLAHKAPGEDAAWAREAGVKVVALAMDDWDGPADIREELTPMKVRINNNSGKPLLVAYNRFSLVADDGKVFRALPLYRLEGSDGSDLTLRDPFVMREPRFAQSGFLVAPFYAPIYSKMKPFGGSIAVDRKYYQLYETYYGGKPLPTTEMQRNALPEGVLGHGGYLEGYLFFEEVPSSTHRVTFKYSLIDPSGSSSLGEIRIPYLVH